MSPSTNLDQLPSSQYSFHTTKERSQSPLYPYSSEWEGWSDNNEKILEETPSEEPSASTPPPNGPLTFPPLYFPDGGPMSFATWETGEE
jgi:hypothetical protein